MSLRAKLPAVAIFVSSIVLPLAAPNSAAAEACLTAPKGQASEGSHWFYRIERPSLRKCWRLVAKEVGGMVGHHQRHAAVVVHPSAKAREARFGLQQAHRFDVERRRDDEIRELKENIRSLTQAGHALRATQAEARVRDLERQKTSLEAAFQPPAEVSLALGSAFFRDGHPDQAEIQWLAAIDANPRLGEAHNNLAVVYMQTDRLDAADQQLKLAEKSGFRVNPQLKQDVKKRRELLNRSR